MRGGGSCDFLKLIQDRFIQVSDVTREAYGRIFIFLYNDKDNKQIVCEEVARLINREDLRKTLFSFMAFGRRGRLFFTRANCGCVIYTYKQLGI